MTAYSRMTGSVFSMEMYLIGHLLLQASN